MPIRAKTLAEMIREILVSLRAGALERRPAFTLLLGSGFSVPIIPTPSQMLKSDIAWWCYCRDKRVEHGFKDRDVAVSEGLVEKSELETYERHLWQRVQEAGARDAETTFALKDG